MPINRYYYIIELVLDVLPTRLVGVWMRMPVDSYTEYDTLNGIMKCIPFEADIDRLELDYAD